MRRISVAAEELWGAINWLLTVDRIRFAMALGGSREWKWEDTWKAARVVQVGDDDRSFK